jgi:HSP20 family protein
MGFNDDPFSFMHREMTRMLGDMSRVFGSGTSLSSGAGEQGGMIMTPRMDVRETEKDIEIQAELPGLNENDLDVSLDDDILTIRGEKKADQQREDHNYHLVERSYGVFQRSMRLPFKVDPNKVNASFQNGVLHLRIEKPSGRLTQGNRIPINKPGQQPANLIDLQRGQTGQQGTGQPGSASGAGGTTGAGMAGAAAGSTGSTTGQNEPRELGGTPPEAGTSAV